jgi:hypothetical protein
MKKLLLILLTILFTAIGLYSTAEFYNSDRSITCKIISMIEALLFSMSPIMVWLAWPIGKKEIRTIKKYTIDKATCAKLINQDENSKRIKLWFLSYFEDKDIAFDHWQIHFIDVKTTEADIAVTVTLGRPGLLIGKHGNTIDDITERLTAWLKKSVKIKVVEFDVFK